jgi:hypothetical protein
MAHGTSRSYGCACPPNSLGAAGDPVGITARRDPAVIIRMPSEIDESNLSVFIGTVGERDV